MATRRVWVYLLLAAAAFLVYLPSLGNGFVDWDDQAYVAQNPHVAELSGRTAAWAFTSFHQANWHPLTWLSHALDRELYGLEPAGHHRTNALLHALNAALLLLALARLTGRFWPSATVAALFALHPLRVENVAWVAERKDLLCSFFVLLALVAYERYARDSSPSRRLGRYLLVALAFVLALLSKPMAVTLPFVLLLLDAWPLGRLQQAPRRVVVEKLPLLALTAASAVVTYLAQAAGRAVQPLEAIPLAERLANVPVAMVAYLAKTLAPWPGTLLPLYTHPHFLAGGTRWAEVAGATLVVAGLTAACLWQWRRRPYLLIGWLLFAGMLVPVIGVVQVGVQAYADRYSYLPAIGLLLALVWLAAEQVGEEAGRRRGAAAALGVLLVAFAALSWRQQAIWRSAETLWTNAAAGEPASPIARLNLANALNAAGRPEEALGHYRRAVALGPRYAPAHAALAVRLGERRDTEAAIAAFRRALELAPADAATRASLGNLLLEAGRSDEGLAELAAAFAADPAILPVRNSWAKALLAAGRAPEAAEVYRETLAFDPSPAAHNNLAIALLRAGRRDEGIAAFREALRLDPGYRTGHLNLSLALRQAGDLEGADRHLARAKELEGR